MPSAAQGGTCEGGWEKHVGRIDNTPALLIPASCQLSSPQPDKVLLPLPLGFTPPQIRSVGSRRDAFRNTAAVDGAASLLGIFLDALKATVFRLVISLPVLLRVLPLLQQPKHHHRVQVHTQIWTKANVQPQSSILRKPGGAPVQGDPSPATRVSAASRAGRRPPSHPPFLFSAPPFF